MEHLEVLRKKIRPIPLYDEIIKAYKAKRLCPQNMLLSFIPDDKIPEDWNKKNIEDVSLEDMDDLLFKNNERLIGFCCHDERLNHIIRQLVLEKCVTPSEAILFLGRPHLFDKNLRWDEVLHGFLFWYLEENDLMNPDEFKHNEALGVMNFYSGKMLTVLLRRKRMGDDWRNQETDLFKRVVEGVSGDVAKRVDKAV